MRDARNAARAHAHHNVSSSDNLGQRGCQRVIIGQSHGMTVPVCPQALDEMLGVKTLDWLFSGGENRQYENHIGGIHTATEIGEQITQPRIAMRLHDTDDASACRFASAAQNSGNLNRMVSIVVKNIDVAHLADMRKATFYAGKA